MNLNSKRSRLIIFDFFGVLSSEVAPKFFSNHFSSDEAKILKDKYFIPGDLGKYTFYEVLKNISLDYNLDYEELVKEFKSYGKLNYELLNKIKELRKNNYVALLSNACSGIFEFLFPNLNFNDYFDKYFISCDYKMKKPSIEFYELCYKSFNNIEEAYFIDDNIENIKVLKNTPINGVLYTSNIELFKLLNKF